MPKALIQKLENLDPTYYSLYRMDESALPNDL